MKAGTTPVLFVLLFASLLRFSAAICYYPNGDASPQDVPCGDDTDHSTCCGPGYACLSNNICMATGLEKQIPNAATYDRGSCTDKTWRSGRCPNFCVNAAHNDTLDGGIGMAKCPGNLDMYYCMDGAPFNCRTGDNVLSFSGSPTAITTIGFVASSTSSTTTTSTSSSSTSTSATSSSSPSTSSTSSAPTSPTSALGSTVTTLETSPAVSSAPKDPANQSSTSPSTGLIAGLAVGISVGIIGLAAAGFMALRRRQANRQVSGAVAQPPPNAGLAYGTTTVYTENEDRKASYPVAYTQPAPVYELPVERPRTPELPAGYR